MPFYIRVPSLITPVHCITITEEPLISPASIPKNTLTPPLQRPYPLANTSKALPVPSPMVTGADDIYSLSSPPPNQTVLSPPNQTEIPFHIKYEENANDLVEIGSISPL